MLAAMSTTASTTISTTPSYDELTRVHARLYRLGHLANIVAWDRDAMMPPKGIDAR